MRELPTRKAPRQPAHDYSRDSIYFVTLCTMNRSCILGDVTNEGRMVLSPIGETAAETLSEIPNHSQAVRLYDYVVMPNHVHMLLGMETGGIYPAPTMTDIRLVIGMYKAAVSRKLGFSIWQRSFHDHVVRSYDDFKRISEYIRRNPEKWREDRFWQ